MKNFLKKMGNQQFSYLSLSLDENGAIPFPPTLAGTASDGPIKIYYDPNNILCELSCQLLGDTQSFSFFSSLQDPGSNVSTDLSGTGSFGPFISNQTFTLSAGILTGFPSFDPGQNFFYIQFYSDTDGTVPLNHDANITISFLRTDYSNGTFSLTPGLCLFEDCLVEMGNGSHKAICDLTVGELLKTPTDKCALIGLLHFNYTPLTAEILRFEPGSLSETSPTSELIITSKHGMLFGDKFAEAGTWKDKSSPVESGKYKMYQLVTFPHSLVLVAGVWVSTLSEDEARSFTRV